MYTHIDVASVCGETYLQSVGKMKFFNVQYMKTKLTFVLSVCTGVIFAISKKVRIFICIKTCHMMKKVVKQLGLRITEHSFSSYTLLSLQNTCFL